MPLKLRKQNISNKRNIVKNHEAQNFAKEHWKKSMPQVLNINKSFSRFYKNINRLINKHAPLKDVSKRRLKLLTKPWLTKGIRRSIRVKNNLFFNSNWNKYKQKYRNKLTALIRLSKQKYYQNLVILINTWFKSYLTDRRQSI